MQSGYVVAVLCSGLLIAAAPAVNDSSQWRGPRRDGVVDAREVPRAWPVELTRGWSVEVGEGHATPVISGETVFVHTREGEEEVVRALRLRDGRELWKQSAPVPYKVNSAATSHGKGPKSTPVVADGRLFTLGISGILSCLDAGKGTLIWRKEFGDEFRDTSPLYGTALSPLVTDDLCIIHAGGHDAGALLALNVKSGTEVWRLKETGPAYTSPIVVEIDGVRQVVTQTQSACIGVDLQSGERLWSHPYRTDYDQNSVTPVVAGDLILFGGYAQPTIALRPRRQEGRWTTEIVWSNAEIPMYMSSPVVVGDVFYGMTQRRRGALFCADTRSGEVRWTGEGRLGDNAALLVAGDKLLVLTTEAKLLVLKQNRERPDIVAEYEVAESPTWAHPVPAHGKLLIKDRTRLTAWSDLAR